jgi:hypothetical protein
MKQRTQLHRDSWRPLVGAAAVAALQVACAPRTSTEMELGEVVAEPVMTTTVSDITTGPQRYVGKVVTVSGEVGRVLGPRWFTIGGQEFGGSEILVLGKSTMPGLVNRLADSGMVMNDIVLVTGVVRAFEEDALEREIGGGLDLDGDVFDPYDAHPVIVMTDLDITPRVDIVPPVVVPGLVLPIIDELVIIDAPDRMPLVGRTVALFNVKVHEKLGERAFWVGSAWDRRFPVVIDSATVKRLADPAAADIRAGATVSVAGVLQRMPQNLADVRTKWGLNAVEENLLRRELIYLAANALVISGADQSSSKARSGRP